MRQLWIFAVLLLALPVFAQDEDMDTKQLFFTHTQASGNRYIEGSSTFPNVQVLDVALDFPAQTVIAATGVDSADVLFYATGINSAGDIGLQEVVLRDGILEKLDDMTNQMSESSVFAMQVEGGNYEPIWSGGREFNFFGASSLSHLVPVAERAYLAVGDNGDLIYFTLSETGEVTENRLSLNLQPDARIVKSNISDLYAVYANATNQRYVHGIMGDSVEGYQLIIFSIVDDALNIVAETALTGDAVYEGLSSLWADLDSDGIDEIITTVSDSRVGSRLRAYKLTEDNQLIAFDGEAIGQPGRWQHQLAVAPFGTNGETELVEVRTPHIGGIVRFYQLRDERLEIIASLQGYTSHVIGSRNLDLAVAGDFNGDGLPEIVLPSQNRQRIAGIQRTEDNATVVWALPLDATLTSNLHAFTLPDGRLGLVAATDSARLRVWIPAQ